MDPLDVLVPLLYAAVGLVSLLVALSRFRADDVASILAIGPAALEVAAPGDQVVVDLPSVEVRSFDAYRIRDLA